jgi:hypothetical protein
MVVPTAMILGQIHMRRSRPQIFDQNGKYRGNLSVNPYDPNSISNPYGRYGSLTRQPQQPVWSGQSVFWKYALRGA